MKRIQVLSSTVWRTLCELWWSLLPTLLWTKRILVSPQRWGEWGRIAKGSCQEVFSWPIVFSRRRKRVCVLPVLLSQVAWTLVMIAYFLFSSFFFVQDSSRWLKCCPVYIYSMWSSHSSAWSQCEWSVWHWYRTADETLLIGYSTLNKDVSSLISIFFFYVPSTWYLDHCFSGAVGSWLVWVHWMLGFKGKGLCFAFAARDKLWSVLDVLLETSARGRSTLGMKVCTTLRRTEGFVVYISQCNDF